MTKSMLFLGTVLLSFGLSSQAQAGCRIYHDRYQSDVIANVDGDRIYRGRYQSDVIANIDGSRIYRGRYQSDVIANIDGNRIYRGRYQSDIIANVDGNRIYRGRYQSDVIGNGENCTPREIQFAAGALFLQSKFLYEEDASCERT